MAEGMKENMSKIKSKDKGLIHLRMEGYILANGKMGNNMGKESSFLQINRRDLGSGKMAILNNGKKRKSEFLVI